MFEITKEVVKEISKDVHFLVFLQVTFVSQKYYIPFEESIFPKVIVPL